MVLVERLAGEKLENCDPGRMVVTPGPRRRVKGVKIIDYPSSVIRPNAVIDEWSWF